jgi:hypothetical protein
MLRDAAVEINEILVLPAAVSSPGSPAEFRRITLPFKHFQSDPCVDRAERGTKESDHHDDIYD